MLKKQKHYEHEGIFSSYEDSELVVFGIPYDGTVSYRPGTRFGPTAIRNELDGIETYSPYQNKDLIDYRVCDIGDLHIPFGNTERILNSIEKGTREILEDNKKTLVLGGEHLITYPMIKAYADKYPSLNIIHFDAHADLRDHYLEEQLSHATVMRRSYECLQDGKLYQFGIRSGTREEFDFAKKFTQMQRFDLTGIEELAKKLGDAPVYVTVDLDVLDPSIFSGTGTPEPGGINFKELVEGILRLDGLNIVGGDLVELSPHYDQSGVSTAVGCKILRELAMVMC